MGQEVVPLSLLPDQAARRRLHGVILDCLERLRPVFVSGNPNGHAFNVRSASGIAIQIRLPSHTPCQPALLLEWEGADPPNDLVAIRSSITTELTQLLNSPPRDFIVLATMDIGTNRILGLHTLENEILLTGATETHGMELEITYHRAKQTRYRYTQEFYVVTPVTAISKAEAGLNGSMRAAELALFLTLLLRYPVYRKEITTFNMGVDLHDLVEAFPGGVDLRDGAQFEARFPRPDMTNHDSIWMADQLIYPDPTPYPSDAAELFRRLSTLTADHRHNFFAAVHAYRLGLRLLIQEPLRGFLPEQSYSLVLFQTALEALGGGRSLYERLLSLVKKRTPAIYARYRASPLSNPDRARNPTIHEGQLFGGELGADAWAEMESGVAIRSDDYFRSVAKAETATAALIVDWLIHSGS